MLNSEGQVRLGPWAYDQYPGKGPNVEPVKAPAVKAGDEFNTLLVVIKGRTVEVAVNGAVVGTPVSVDGDFTPGVLVLQTLAASQQVRIEVSRVSVWVTPAARATPPAKVP
jgi:hypothetical protein